MLYLVKCYASVMMNTTTVAGFGVVFVLLLLVFRWRWRVLKGMSQMQFEPEYPPCTGVQLVHRLCPHHNVVQGFQVEEKDSLDEHLDVLTRKLAEKEGRLQLSKYKIRQTQNEIENLHAIDHDVRVKYREIMDSLRTDLMSNEKECKKLQEQIEWVSKRRAELKDEVRRGQRLYGEAAAELASNLAELQRGRVPEYHIIDKPYKQNSVISVRHRKEPLLPRASPCGSTAMKITSTTPPVLSQAEMKTSDSVTWT